LCTACGCNAGLSNRRFACRYRPPGPSAVLPGADAGLRPGPASARLCRRPPSPPQPPSRLPLGCQQGARARRPSQAAAALGRAAGGRPSRGAASYSPRRAGRAARARGRLGKAPLGLGGLGHRVLKRDVLAGELLVDAGEGVDLVLSRVAVLGVQEHLGGRGGDSRWVWAHARAAGRGAAGVQRRRGAGQAPARAPRTPLAKVRLQRSGPQHPGPDRGPPPA
jgi:hypothetical protein